MKSLIQFSLIGIIIFCLHLNVFGQTEFPLKPLINYTNGFTESSNDLLEIGLSIDLEKKDSTAQDKGYIKFGARVPHKKDDKNLASIDKSTDNMNFFLASEFLLKNVPISKNNNTVFWGIEPSIEFGRKKYEYYSDSIKSDADESWKNSFAFELKSRYFISKRKIGAWQWGLYGRLRYSISNKAADEVYLLQSSSNIVDKLIVTEPSTKKTLSPAIGANIYPGTDLPFSFSPILYYYWLSEYNESGFEREKFRAEQWLYFYPLSEKNTGLRIGFGLYQDIYTYGKQDDENTSGAMINVKMETNILKSIF